MTETVHIPGYRVIRPIGIGGMASVYLAVQESLDREVALKVMSPALAANHEFTERFLKERRITARLSHPNLVTVFDIGQHGTHYYLAAEYIPGGTLRDKLNQGISVAEALDVVRDVAHGLQMRTTRDSSIATSSPAMCCSASMAPRCWPTSASPSRSMAPPWPPRWAARSARRTT